jgi:hypothetical protein
MAKQWLEGIESTTYLPIENIVRGSGSSYCGSNRNLGTLGVRVDMSPNTQYYFIATYHNFAETYTDYNWVFNVSSIPTLGQQGKVINRKYKSGPGGLAMLDCALIALNSTSPSAIGAGLFQGPGTATRTLNGTASARIGTMVTKYGMTTGLTYGIVMALPRNLDPAYDPYIVFVQPCDKNGYPICGDFCSPGDSGAPVIDQNGYVVGLIVQSSKDPDPAVGNLGVVNRIDPIQSALGVTVHPG